MGQIGQFFDPDKRKLDEQIDRWFDGFFAFRHGEARPTDDRDRTEGWDYAEQDAKVLA